MMVVRGGSFLDARSMFVALHGREPRDRTEINGFIARLKREPERLAALATKLEKTELAGANARRGK